jgi:hypothetical protein
MEYSGVAPARPAIGPRRSFAPDSSINQMPDKPPTISPTTNRTGHPFVASTALAWEGVSWSLCTAMAYQRLTDRLPRLVRSRHDSFIFQHRQFLGPYQGGVC